MFIALLPLRPAIICCWLLFLFTASGAQAYHPESYDLPQLKKADSITAALSARPIFQFFGVQGKYPESSLSLAHHAQTFITAGGKAFTGSGYIRFGLVVDSSGGNHALIYNLAQTDEKYQRAYFDKELVEGLYAFVATLNRWNPGTNPNYPQHLPYQVFLEFKIQNGSVVNVIP